MYIKNRLHILQRDTTIIQCLHIDANISNKSAVYLKLEIDTIDSYHWGADCIVLLDLHRSSNRTELYYECVVYCLLYLSTSINTRLAHSCLLHLCNYDSRNTKLTDNCWLYVSLLSTRRPNHFVGSSFVEKVHIYNFLSCRIWIHSR
jgi:hypothetical protein